MIPPVSNFSCYRAKRSTVLGSPNHNRSLYNLNHSISTSTPVNRPFSSQDTIAIGPKLVYTDSERRPTESSKESKAASYRGVREPVPVCRERNGPARAGIASLLKTVAQLVGNRSMAKSCTDICAEGRKPSGRLVSLEKEANRGEEAASPAR